ncbi:hypothetical protein [Nocardioides aurantiacus]|uniref:Uncharacterized protein n=1 Tax=Nocardioides aurantiacus TaxID=86796 RepID=A0A3N2CVG5_9ACTN|nr:hypothetical protein [Nocardioides aurantiacus]ROR91456.1 hypothetical protein EDD33_2323 [Nocardioides aurantiacus]
MRPRARLLLAAGLLAATGCGGPDVDDPGYRRQVQDAADAARAEVDDLAAQVGSGARPSRDELLTCERGGEEGRQVAYSVRVEVGDAARAVAGNPLRDRYTSRGWAVTYRGTSTVLFQKAGTQLVLILDAGTGTASVGGTGGCVT